MTENCQHRHACNQRASAREHCLHAQENAEARTAAVLLLQEGSGSRGHQSQHMHACMPDYNRRLSLCTPCMHHSQPPTHFSTENLGQLGASTAFQNILTFQYSVRLYVPKASDCLPSRPYCTVSGTGISSVFSSPRSLAYAAMISVIETCTGKSIPVMRSACIHFDHPFRPLLQALARSAPVWSDMWDAANVFK